MVIIPPPLVSYACGCMNAFYVLFPLCTGLIHKAYIAKRDGQPFEIWGTGKPLRQFIYSLDLGRLFIWTLRKYDNVSPLILSVDEADEISIGDVSKLVLKATKFEGDIKYLTDKADGQVYIICTI